MTESIAPTITDRYIAVWSEPDPESRRAAIADLWAPDGVEFVEGSQFRGREELDARIAHAYQEFVASGKYAVTSAEDMARHHDIITFTIQLTAPCDPGPCDPGPGDPGEVAWAARVFLLLDENGQIREDYQLTVKPLAA